MNEKELLSAAVRLLIAVKGTAMRCRLSGAAGFPSKEGNALSGVEGDVEEFLNELSLARPDLAEGWEMGREFADDAGVEWASVADRIASMAP